MQNYTTEEQGVHNKDFVNLQVHQSITRLFKYYLNVLDDLKKENKISAEKSEQLRKKILDSGNECSREITNLLDVFDFYINPERLKTAQEQRKIIKKTVSNAVLTIE
jgi:hypothetical protein